MGSENCYPIRKDANKIRFGMDTNPIRRKYTAMQQENAPFINS
jgi:hypothetical protein